MICNLDAAHAQLDFFLRPQVATMWHSVKNVQVLVNTAAIGFLDVSWACNKLGNEALPKQLV